MINFGGPHAAILTCPMIPAENHFPQLPPSDAKKPPPIDLGQRD